MVNVYRVCKEIEKFLNENEYFKMFCFKQNSYGWKSSYFSTCIPNILKPVLGDFGEINIGYKNEGELYCSVRYDSSKSKNLDYSALLNRIRKYAENKYLTYSTSAYDGKGNLTNYVIKADLKHIDESLLSEMIYIVCACALTILIDEK